VGLPGMVLSAIAAAVGAIMYWAVTYQGTGFRLSTVGIILMIAGAFGFVVSAIIFAVSRGPVRSNRHSMDRQVVDAQGNSSSVHEDSK
jgi:phosphate/sulfate permease